MENTDSESVTISKAMWDGLLGEVRSMSSIILELKSLVINQNSSVPPRIVEANNGSLLVRGDSVSSVTSGSSFFPSTPSSITRRPKTAAELALEQCLRDDLLYQAKPTAHLNDILADASKFDSILQDQYPIWFKLR